MKTIHFIATEGSDDDDETNDTGYVNDNHSLSSYLHILPTISSNKDKSPPKKQKMYLCLLS